MREGLADKPSTLPFPAEILWSEYFIQGIIRPDDASWMECRPEDPALAGREILCHTLVDLFHDEYIDRYRTLVPGLWTGNESGLGPDYYLDMLASSGNWVRMEQIGPVPIFRRRDGVGN